MKGPGGERKLIFVATSLLLLLVAALIRFSSGDPPLLDPVDSGRPGPRDLPTAQQHPRGPAKPPPLPRETNEGTPPSVPIDFEMPDVDDALWIPDYGHMIERAQSKVVVGLRDRQSRPLLLPPYWPAEAKAWRILGDCRLPLPCRIERGQSRVVLDGDGLGLEPGGYEMTLAVCGVADQSIHIEVTRDIDNEAWMSVPVEVRPFAVRFEESTAAGARPIPLLPGKLEINGRRSDLGRRDALPHRALPVRSMRMDDPDASVAPTRRPGVTDRTVVLDQDELDAVEPLLLDDGLLTIDVLEGADFRLVLPQAGTMFEGAEEGFLVPPGHTPAQPFVVLVRPTDEYRSFRFRRKYEDDLKRRRRSRRRRPAADPSQDPADLADLDFRSVRRKLVDPIGGLTVVFKDQLAEDLGPRFRNLGQEGIEIQQRNGQAFVDLRQNHSYLMRVLDGSLFDRTETISIDPSSAPWDEIVLGVGATKTEIIIEETPTLASYAAHLTGRLLTGRSGDTDTPSESVRTGQREGTHHRLSSLVDRDLLTYSGRAPTLVLDYRDRATGPATAGPSPSVVGGLSWSFILEPEEKLAFVAGRLHVPLTQRVPQFQDQCALVFRCVGAVSEGIPTAEALVVPLDDDLAHRALLAHSKWLAGREPRIRHDGPGEEPRVQVPETTAAQVLEVVGDLRSLFDERQPLLELYCREGLWYLPAKPLRADEFGFVTSQDTGVAPGALGVLYLWSRSRDELQPDFRLVFRAEAGVTDLGSIPLPSYTAKER
ncbi:MAG: hypothetical protein KDB53_04050 [Planctomycetes bacterium]|nr:hypothetical protein [Planctomycetota bacterium]